MTEKPVHLLVILAECSEYDTQALMDHIHEFLTFRKHASWWQDCDPVTELQSSLFVAKNALQKQWRENRTIIDLKEQP